MVDNFRDTVETIGFAVLDRKLEVRDESINRVSDNEHGLDGGVVSERMRSGETKRKGEFNGPLESLWYARKERVGDCTIPIKVSRLEEKREEGTVGQGELVVGVEGKSTPHTPPGRDSNQHESEDESQAPCHSMKEERERQGLGSTHWFPRSGR
jgi:hypothetical protein